MVAPIWNFRMPAILEGWIDKVLSPPWAFRFKKLIGNYGYPQGNLSGKKAVIFCTYGSPRFAVATFFLNMPVRRLKRGIFYICGITNILYRRYFAVPFVSEKKRKEFLEDVKKTASRYFTIYGTLKCTESRRNIKTFLRVCLYLKNLNTPSSKTLYNSLNSI